MNTKLQSTNSHHGGLVVATFKNDVLPALVSASDASDWLVDIADKLLRLRRGVGSRMEKFAMRLRQTMQFANVRPVPVSISQNENPSPGLRPPSPHRMGRGTG